MTLDPGGESVPTATDWLKTNSGKDAFEPFCNSKIGLSPNPCSTEIASVEVVPVKSGTLTGAFGSIGASDGAADGEGLSVGFAPFG